MKKILGLDIGTTSIGWAIVEASDEKKINEITGKEAETDINNDRVGIYKDAVGVRIISQDTERFDRGLTLNDSKGNTLTPTANRRVKRGGRRMKSRYKLRRGKLLSVLNVLGMKPEGSFIYKSLQNNTKGKWIVDDKWQGSLYTKIKTFTNDENGNKKRIKRNRDIGEELYELRNKALTEKIELQEWGRIILHLNQWRGYSSDRFKKEEGETTKKGDKEIYTSVVVSIEGPFPHDKKNHRFKITFENGNMGWQVRNLDKPESEFKNDKQLYSYSFNEKYEPIEDIKQIIKEKEVDKSSYAFRKKEINDSLKEFIENTSGTVGSYFFQKFYVEKSRDRIRNNHVDRDWYEDEFNKIWEFQFEKHQDFLKKVEIEDVIKIAFKDYQPILNEIQRKAGIKEQLKYLIKDKIIFFQRPWQQAKNKGQCPFEKIKVKKEITVKGTGEKKTIEVYVGRTVIPRSHPLFQEFKIWQQINNVRVYLKSTEKKIDLFGNQEMFKKYVGIETSEAKLKLYDDLQKSKTLSWKSFAEKELGLKNKEITDKETGEVIKCNFEYNFRKLKRDKVTYEDIKLKGNTTKVSLQNILSDKDISWFNAIYKKSKDVPYKHNQKKEEYNYKICEHEVSNFQLLWETIYDITIVDKEKLKCKIKNKFPLNTFSEEQLIELSNLKFDDAGMGSLSAKAIRQILPLMSNGNNITEKAKEKIHSLIDLNNSKEEKAKDKDEKLESLKNFITDKKARLRLSNFFAEDNFTYLNYWEASAVIYGSHSSKSTLKKPEISRVENHSMNNPIVEKIVNETISIVNEIHTQYGFDEVRIELSRELKATMDERQQMWEAMNNNAEKNEWAKQMLRELKSDSQHINSDLETTNKSNLDKIKIIEDVVKFKNAVEYKQKVKEYNLGEPSKAEVKKYLMWLEQNFHCPYTNQPIPLTDIFARGKAVEVEHIIPRERYYLNSYANKVITWKEVNQAKANHGNRTAYEFIVSKRVEETVKVGNKEFPLVSKESWEEHITSMFPKGGKRTNLLRKEIPEDPINRTLNETQYINKKLKEKLAELVGEQKVWVTSGAVTDILRERWHLNGIMKELLRSRFENFEIPTGKKTFTLKTIAEQEKMVDDINEALNAEVFEGFKISTGKKNIEIKDTDELKKISDELKNLIRENIEALKQIKPYKYSSTEESSEIKRLTHWTKQYNSKRNEEEDVEIFEGFSKRLDHRHHAIDAIIIACTKQNHIQYINSLNAINNADMQSDENIKSKYVYLKNEVCVGNSSKKFITPWENDSFIADIKNTMNGIIVSHKNTRLLISPSKNKFSENKAVSIRGELHKETNYAKKKYFEGERTSIKKLIPALLNLKMKNQYQSMIHFKKFEEVIKETVLKEKYQKILIPLFERYESEKLNASLCKEYSKSILNEIELNKLLIDKTNKPLEWLSTYSVKDKSVRPNGLSMNLNSDEILSNKTGIADPRIKRLAGYRLEYVNKKKKDIDKLDLGTAEKNKLKREVETLPLYSNAIYEVRVKRSENKFEWIELKDFDWNDFDKIEYTKQQKIDTIKTDLVKNKLKEIGFEKLKESYFDTPIFISSKPIIIKKVRQKSWFQDLYEVTPGRYVYSLDTFMVYLFKNKNDDAKNSKREVKFLKYIDAISIINSEKPTHIDYKKLIEKEKTNSEALNNVEYELLFTLAKNDLVYLPNNSQEVIENIDWDNIREFSSKLFIVKDMNPSRNEIVFQQFYKADSIKISEADSKSLFKNSELKAQIEGIKYGTVPMLQTCIKVFSNKLGNKVIPYWKFPNGCWNKERAIELQLVNS